jgi:cysteine desulfurase
MTVKHPFHPVQHGPRRALYFDHNATSPVSIEHWAEIAASFSDQLCGNPSSPHAHGRYAQVKLAEARRSLAAALHADPAEVVFLSSATEANNMVIRGISETHNRSDLPAEAALPTASVSTPAHVVANACAHPSVREPLIKAERLGILSLSWIPPIADQNDYARAVLSALRPETILICLMSANNETGRIYPVKAVADRIHQLRFPQSRSSGHPQPKVGDESGSVQDQQTWTDDPMATTWEGPGQQTLLRLHLHVDGTQSFGKSPPCEWTSPGMDSLAVSGHKIGALPGSAALIIRRGRKIPPLLLGGAQERSRRAGTENVPAAVSLGLRARALSDVDHLMTETNQMRQRAVELEMMLRELSETTGRLTVHSCAAEGLPNTVHFTLDPSHRLVAEDVLIELDLLGIAASSGSACSSGTNRPSQVLLAEGLDPVRAANAVRISAGPGWTSDGFAQLSSVLRSALLR